MFPPLPQEKLDELAPDIKQLLESYFHSQSELEEELRTKYERLRVDSEQRYFELEKQRLADQIRLEAECKSAAELHSQFVDLENKYSSVSEKYRDLQTKHFEKCDHWGTQEKILASAKAKLEVEKSELTELLDKRSRDVENLTGELKLFSDRLNEVTKLRVTAENQAGEARSELVILQHRETRLKQELESIKLQNDWMSKEIEERNMELMMSRKEKAVKVLELQGLLDISSAELEQAQHSLESAKMTNIELTEQMDQYIKKLKDARDINTQLEEQYREELNAQEKLLELYKKMSVESEEKVSEMKKAVEELQKMLKQASQVYEELQAEKDEDNRMSQELIRERDTHIAALEKELSNANELLELSRCNEKQLSSVEDSEIVSSAAATVSRLVKSGMTLTQIYSEYAKVCGLLQTEKDENKRLGDYLDRILQEIEQNAPLMKKQRQDCERAMATVAQLNTQLESAMKECERCRISSESDHRRCADMTRENQRLKQQTFDLSRQVKYLLKELEEARGTVVRMSSDAIGLPDSSSSSLLITEKLVTFRSIEELHEQNQKLLAVVRELSENQEQKDIETSEMKVTELQQQLELALNEVEELKRSRQRQVEMVESVVQQRDLYRMLAQSPVSTQPVSAQTSDRAGNSTNATATVVPPASTVLSDQQLKAFEESKNALKELQEEMSTYRREKAENERLLNEQIERSTKEASELRIQNAKLASQLDYLGERLKIVASNSESHNKEIDSLKDKNSKLMTNVAKHQQAVTTLQQELLSTQEKLARAEVRCHNLTAEKESLKNSELRLENEVEMLRRNQHARDELVLRLEAIQNNLERSEFETRTRLTHQIEKLERDNALLRKKADGHDEEQRSFVLTLERQLAESRLELDGQRGQCSNVAEQLRTVNEHVEFLKTELHTVNEELQTTKSKLAATLEAQQGDGSQNSLEYQLSRYKDLLSEANRNASSLESQLNLTQQQLTQYREIANSVEKSLHEQNIASKQLQQDLENKITCFVQDKDILEKRIIELEVELSRLSDENSSLISEKSSLIQQREDIIKQNSEAEASLTGQLIDIRKQLDDLSQQLSVSKENERAARADCEQQSAEARQAQQKYEIESRLHANDTESLDNLTSELEKVRSQLESALAEAKTIQANFESSQLSWVEVEQKLKLEISKSHEKLVELESENSSLHQQMQTMVERTLALQSQHAIEHEQMQQASGTIEETYKSSSVEELLEVIRFLRKEKELAEARFEVLQTETTRLRQQTINLKKQAESAQKALADQQETSEINLQTAAQHAELLRKVETLNLLQGTIQQLQEENNNLTAQLVSVTSRAKTLEGELQPLKEKHGDIVAERDSLLKEVEILQVEVERWKTRTNGLIEQCNKFDPEEHKKAIEERDQLSRQLMTMNEQISKQKAELSHVNMMLKSAESESLEVKQNLISAQTELNESKASLLNKDNEIETKNTTINQLRGVARKYKTLSEQAQKELDELKTKSAAANETSISDAVALRSRLTVIEQERDTVTSRLGSADVEKQEAVRKAVDLEKRERELMEQVDKLAEEKKRTASEYEVLNNEHQKLLQQHTKDEEDKARLETENSTIVEEKKKILLTLQAAKQRLVTLRTEKDQLEITCSELRKQIESSSTSGVAPVLNLPTDAKSSDELTLRVSALESELSEMERARTQQLSESQQSIENLEKTVEKLRNENRELQQKIQLFQSSKITSASPAKPTVSAPPVERSLPVAGMSSEQQGPLRKANIRPMASQPPHVRTVQPVRSSVTETRAMASIRPIAASVMSSSSSVSTPMATVMPTTASMSEGEGTLVLASVAPQSVAVVQQQQPQQQQQMGPLSGRPTQQVQPVSSHVEEATVSSSEEQQQSDVGHWWHDATPSTSSEHGSSSSNAGGLAGVGKRPRDDTHLQEEAASEPDTEAPSKRSKQSASEVADTTETTSNNLMLVAAAASAAAAGAESEREAASVAQIDTAAVEPVVETRRETEPVSTSLSMEEHSRGPSDNSQDLVTDHHAGVAIQGTSSSTRNDELPEYLDYQELQLEQAALDYDIRPSTSHANSGTPLSDEGQDDNGDQGNGDDYPTGDDRQGAVDDDDVILVDDDETGVDEVNVLYSGMRGATDDYAENSDDEAEHGADIGDDYQVEGEDYELVGIDVDNDDMPDEGDDSYSADINDDADRQDDESDVIVVDDGTARSGRGNRRAVDDAQDQSTASAAATVTTSVHAQAHAAVRHMVAVVPSSTSSIRPSVVSASASAIIRQQPSLSGQLSSISRSTLMPFLFGNEMASVFDLGDDSIVPSTPTLQLPHRSSDGFAEAVCSPQVRDEGFLFSSSSEVPHSELAHQEGVGVDVTRMDLSQFDEAAAAAAAGRGNAAAATASIVQSHLATASVVGAHQTQQQQQQQQLESTTDAAGSNTDSARNVMPEATSQSASESAASSPEIYLLQQHLVDDSPSLSSQEEQPSTSQQDRSAPSQDGSTQVQTKPKIQRIVWDSEPRSSTGSSSSQQSGLPSSAGSVQGTVTPLMSTQRSRVAPGMAYHSSAVTGGPGGYRGIGQVRVSPRAQLQQAGNIPMAHHRQPGVAPSQRTPQVARRARGRGTGGPPRNYF